uniref:alcohol dehydrogenase n=1 Tax=Acrobeloides nanus TaxID=290746 RepID=A0A914EHG3_9BILA
MVASTITIPKTQKAQLTCKSGLDTEYTEIPVPEPKDDELLVHLLYSGVCHSDVSVMKNKFPLPIPLSFPNVAGHEGAGIVVKIGKEVTGFEEGERVGVTIVNRLCQTCEFCKRTGAEAFCDAPTHLTTAKWGTFQQYITVSALHAHKIPDGVDLAKAAPTQCAGLTVYRALKETNTRPGQFVAINGAAGGLGSFGLQFAKAMGLRPIAIDFGQAKQDHCLRQGAEFFIDAQTQNVVEEMLKVTNGCGPHGVINVAPAAKPLEDALLYVRKTGTIVIVGLPTDGKFSVNTNLMVFKGITIKGTFLGSREDVAEVLQFLARGLIDIPIEIVGLSELPDAIKRLDNCQVKGRIVLDTSK